MRRSNRISLNHVRDTVYAEEGSEELRLSVDDDAMAITRRIRQAMREVEAAKDEPEKVEGAAMAFAVAVFGEEQAARLLAFYHGNRLAVFEWTNRYFAGRLIKKITKVQKRAKAV